MGCGKEDEFVEESKGKNLDIFDSSIDKCFSTVF